MALTTQPTGRRQRIALGMLCLYATACSSQTITLSRWVPSDVAMGSISTLALTSSGGNVGDDGAHLLRRAIQDLGPYEVVHDPQLASPPEDIDGALMWGRQLNVDGVVTVHLSVDEVALGFRRAPSTTIDGTIGCTWLQEASATVRGYIAIADVDSGRTLLFEPVEHSYSTSEALCVDNLEDNLASCLDVNASAPWQESYPTTDSDHLKMAALQDFAHSFAHRLVAHHEGEQVMLYADRSLPQSQRAISALLMNDWDGAVAIYRSGIREMNTWTTPKWAQARAHYNLGTTLSFGGLIEEGLTELHVAQTLSPSAVFEEQIERIKTYRNGARAVASTRRLWHCHRTGNDVPECAHAKIP